MQTIAKCDPASRSRLPDRLPQHYLALEKALQAIFTTFSANSVRGVTMEFKRLKSCIETTTRRPFAMTLIQQLETLLPDLFLVGVRQGDYCIELRLPAEVSAPNQAQLTPLNRSIAWSTRLMTARPAMMATLHEVLRQQVQTAHAEFVRKKTPECPFDPMEMRTFHSAFRLDTDCPPVPAAPLPSLTVGAASTTPGGVRNSYPSNTPVPVSRSSSNSHCSGQQADRSRATVALSELVCP
ncbi:hypothetical protein PAPYR_8870 [Paratrimastix pyriformis]|uniref:CDT1 Geminin-binding domain-containing protein n=1 Tax=Paratrimastix pyriformis TaxID=342808 RepID=A0ABQ8U9P4_9EUKA|nr:hypothetical protein PAPYR_8870 [Paratrimastix pyriformis]